MKDSPVPLTALTEAQRAQAQTRFSIIRPALEYGVSQARVARTHNIPASTVQRWIKRCREKGLVSPVRRLKRPSPKSAKIEVCIYTHATSYYRM